ncbi:MAG: 3'-5' exonuclease [Parcubacteria group bacterium]|nr:3'-5' exonuclease [Parcubacteria group bacterium]
MARDFFELPIAMTDIETSGVDCIVWKDDVDGIKRPEPHHEIIEIGLVLFDPISFEVIDTLDVKVKPTRMHLATPEALKVNGYKEEDWTHALSLKEAMERYGALTRESVFWAWNVTFDWGFISNAFNETGVSNQMDYRRFDLMSDAYGKLKGRSGFKNLKQSHAAEFLGVPREPEVHRAINGAMVAYQIYKKLNA